MVYKYLYYYLNVPSIILSPSATSFINIYILINTMSATNFAKMLGMFINNHIIINTLGCIFIYHIANRFINNHIIINTYKKELNISDMQNL